MHRADIVASLRKKNSGVCRVAEALQVNPGTVSAVIAGHDASRRIAKKISEVTGIPVSRLWPGRYERALTRKAA